MFELRLKLNKLLID